MREFLPLPPPPLFSGNCRTCDYLSGLGAVLTLRLTEVTVCPLCALAIKSSSKIQLFGECELILTQTEPTGAVTLQPPPSFFIGCWREKRRPSVCSGGHALGAVFNQLVRSRAQLLVAE